jgi:eukaryotic translation initiation factor 2C
VYDGRKNLFSPRGIPLLDVIGLNAEGEPDYLPQVFVVEYYEDGKDGVRDNLVDDKILPKQYQIHLRKLREISMNSLVEFLNGNTAETPIDAITVVDVLLRHRPSLLYTTVGRSFYTPDMAISIAQGAQLWQGFHQSVKAAAGNLLINLDVSATAFYEPGKRFETLCGFGTIFS